LNIIQGKGKRSPVGGGPAAIRKKRNPTGEEGPSTNPEKKQGGGEVGKSAYLRKKGRRKILRNGRIATKKKEGNPRRVRNREEKKKLDHFQKIPPEGRKA